ncbi:sugar translocase [Hyphomicrobium methylovorum]|uniref:GtrA family protein n=1 Tax=Hyphomicrobium methylovorum TaxID=84 RepID=UPI0015E77ACF|nr:GtrA family protein [Hyphomicrobium methylovorum]MBA2125886.1 sugar translocase [Hyphomicrobium methylovorum]
MSDLARLARFAVSGSASTATHIAIAWSCIQHLGISPPLANGIAFSCATLVSCVLNTRWTFATQWSRKKVFRFLVVTFCMALVSMALAYVVELVGLSYVVGIAAIVIFVPPMTYILHASWTYRDDIA